MNTQTLSNDAPIYAAFIEKFVQIFNPQERAELQPQIVGMYKKQPEMSSDQFIKHLLNSKQAFQLSGQKITFPDKGLTLEQLQ